MKDTSKVTHILLSCGWVPIKPGSLSYSHYGSSENQWFGEPGFSCVDVDGSKIQGPAKCVQAVKEK